MWEIDILEYVGREPDIILLLLPDSHGNTINKKQGLKILKKGIIYAMDWSKDKIDFFVDII
jgi:hypothetical protein